MGCHVGASALASEPSFLPLDVSLKVGAIVYSATSGCQCGWGISGGKKWRLGWNRSGASTQESGEKGDREDGLRLEQNHVRSTLVLVLLNP